MSLPATIPGPALDASALETVVVHNDLSKLSAAQRLDYYAALCRSLGLNPLTRPFQYITLNNKLTLYATRDATEQLRKINGVSLEIVGRHVINDVYVVTARAVDSTGRTDESTGAVPIGNIQGEALANAYMKAETKAKRRVTLSICGLGALDEAETPTVPGAEIAIVDEKGEIKGALPAARPDVHAGEIVKGLKASKADFRKFQSACKAKGVEWFDVVLELDTDDLTSIDQLMAYVEDGELPSKDDGAGNATPPTNGTDKTTTPKASATTAGDDLDPHHETIDTQGARA